MVEGEMGGGGWQEKGSQRWVKASIKTKTAILYMCVQ